MKCPNCHEPLPSSACLPLSFGVRSYRCRNCGAISRMHPMSYFKWSLVPFAVFLLLAVGTFLTGLLWYFVGLVIVIRIAWIFVAPRIVPLEVLALPKTKK